MAKNKEAPGKKAEAPHIAVSVTESELELGTKLEHARIVGRGHLAERRIVRTRIDTLELRVVESVKAFSTDLQSQALCKCKRLERCQIEVE